MCSYKTRQKESDNFGGLSPDDEMEACIVALESAVVDIRERLSRIETRLETMATREDLHKEIFKIMHIINGQTWKLMSGVAALITIANGLLFAALRYVPQG